MLSSQPAKTKHRRLVRPSVSTRSGLTTNRKQIINNRTRNTTKENQKHKQKIIIITETKLLPSPRRLDTPIRGQALILSTAPNVMMADTLTQTSKLPSISAHGRLFPIAPSNSSFQQCSFQQLFPTMLFPTMPANRTFKLRRKTRQEIDNER